MSDDLIRALTWAARDTAETLVERLQTGVRIPSVNPASVSVASGEPAGEGEFQAFFAGELERLGCHVECWEPDADALVERFPEIRPFLSSSGFRGRPNVVARPPVSEVPDGPLAHLILNSHADTVGPGDASAWRFPPFSGAVADARLFGLGAVDAKGCLFAFLGALATLRAARVTLRKNVLLQSVVDEETGGGGTLECIRRGYTATAAVVGEPTSLTVCPGSRGSVMLILRVVGRKAHPGEGWRGVNAVRMAWQYVEALEQLRRELDRTRMHPLWATLPVGHVWNLMAINSGPPGRAVPDRCEVHYSVGAIGTERVAELREIVRATVVRVTASDPWLTAHPPTLTWSDRSTEPAVTDSDHPAVAAMMAAGAALGESSVPPRAFSAASDARHLMNAAGIPAFHFGPGDVHCCHSPEEALAVDDIHRAVAWLALFLARYCGVARGPG